jgi:hypothetical protein
LTTEEWPATEEWRAIDGYDGWYEVSNHGRVRSWKNSGSVEGKPKGGFFRAAEPRLLVQSTTPSGHKKLVLWAGGRFSSRTVHQLVAAAFIGPRPKGFETCHGDGDPTNNHVGNLRYGTHAENVADKLKHGTQPRGEGHGRSRLTEPDVVEIRRLLARGEPVASVASRYGVSYGAINGIRRGKNWGWLEAA